MDKLIEKLLTFVIVFAFLTVSFALLNINKIEYNIKIKDLKNDDEVMVFESNFSNWLLNHTSCKKFGILRRDNYAITQCELENGDIEYLKDDVKKMDGIDGDYFYFYNDKERTFTIFSKSKNKELVEKDFYHLLGVEFKKSDNKKSRFKLLKKEEIVKPQLYLMKKDGE